MLTRRGGPICLEESSTSMNSQQVAMIFASYKLNLKP